MKKRKAVAFIFLFFVLQQIVLRSLVKATKEKIISEKDIWKENNLFGTRPQRESCPHVKSFEGTQSQRESCPHMESFGCFGDVLEKICLLEPQTFPIFQFFEKKYPESIQLCCCPEPYKSCSPQKRNPTCTKAIERVLTDKFIQLLKSESTFEVKQAAAAVGAQKVREIVWNENERCQATFAPPKPYSQCYTRTPSEKKSGMRVIEREDLNCEALTWQYEILGDGDPEEFSYNKCPLPSTKANYVIGNLRKGPSERGLGGRSLLAGRKLQDARLNPHATRHFLQDEGRRLHHDGFHKQDDLCAKTYGFDGFNGATCR
jgi:hypothetical protein